MIAGMHTDGRVPGEVHVNPDGANDLRVALIVSGGRMSETQAERLVQFAGRPPEFVGELFGLAVYTKDQAHDLVVVTKDGTRETAPILTEQQLVEAEASLELMSARMMN